MADRALAAARRTYLVEHYRSGSTVDGLKQRVALARDATDELVRAGRSVRCLRSTTVPADESLLRVLAAAGEDLVRAVVRAAYARAALAFERLSIVLAEDGEPFAAATPTERCTR